MFAIELGWSADIPATLNTGSPSFGTSLGLPVSKTSWHCCGSQHSPTLWPQNKASGARRAGPERRQAAAAAQGLWEGLAQRGPLPRAMPRAPTARVASPQAGRWLRASLASGPALRKLVCPSGSQVPRAVGAASLAAASPRPAAAAPRAACQAATSILRRRRPRGLPPAAVTAPAC